MLGVHGLGWKCVYSGVMLTLNGTSLSGLFLASLLVFCLGERSLHVFSLGGPVAPTTGAMLCWLWASCRGCLLVVLQCS